MPRRLAYLGTPELAVPPLRALVDAGHEVVVVLTRADRRRGRGVEVSPSPVKAEAQRLGIPVVHGYEGLLEAAPELGVVVAYGRIIPVSVLEPVPMVNLHFSLLPRWRGAAPVERAILAGDEVTGVCVMAVEAGLDTGGIYASATVPIGTETLSALRGELVDVGTRLLLQVLDGPLPDPVPQEGEPTYAAKLDPAELQLDWERPAIELARIVRLGGAWTSLRGRRVKILEAASPSGPDGEAASDELPPGTVRDLSVATGRGWLTLVRVQPEGKAAMEADAWLRGARLVPGERLGS